jgi:hypothetical protein
MRTATLRTATLKTDPIETIEFQHDPHLVYQMWITSHSSAISMDAYMKDTAKVMKRLYKKSIRTTSAKAFIEDLVSAGFMEVTS